MKDKEKQIEFKVIDNNTGKEADIGKIAIKEDWAKGLMYCDMQGFAILDDGNLVLLDECGKYEYCPSERFSIKFENSVVLSREEYNQLVNTKKFFETADSQISAGNLLVYLKEFKEETSKETAEKILFDLVGHTFECDGWTYTVDVDDVKWLADKYKVEIKE